MAARSQYRINHLVMYQLEEFSQSARRSRPSRLFAIDIVQRGIPNGVSSGSRIEHL